MMNPLDTLASVCSDIDPLADLTWMIERLHSNATTMPPITQHKSAGLSVVRPPSTMSQRPPYAVDVGIETTCRIAEVGSGDVELRWKCTKPRSVLDKAGSTKSNISSYGTAVTTQGPLNFLSGRVAASPPLTTANRPRVQDESPVHEGDLPPKRRRRVTAAATSPYVSLQYMDNNLEVSGLRDGSESLHAGTVDTLSKPRMWSVGQHPNRTARRTGVRS